MSDENGPSEQAGHAAPADGTFCWNELRTRDVAAAKSFYADVFGWTSFFSDTATAEIYTIFKCGDQDVGSLLAMPPEAGAAPPAWLSYIAVDDVDAAAEK
ncbi:MAG: VOC family protein, partial [Planctomycetota bacterium]